MIILTWIVVGLIAGWLADMIMHTDNGLLGDIVLGIIGAVLGGFVFNMLGAPGVTGLNLYSIVVATIGAAIVIWLGRLVRR